MPAAITIDVPLVWEGQEVWTVKQVEIARCPKCGLTSKAIVERWETTGVIRTSVQSTSKVHNFVWEYEISPFEGGQARWAYNKDVYVSYEDANTEAKRLNGIEEQADASKDA